MIEIENLLAREGKPIIKLPSMSFPGVRECEAFSLRTKFLKKLPEALSSQSSSSFSWHIVGFAIWLHPWVGRVGRLGR